MARISDLIRVLAHPVRRPEKSLNVIARSLREGGLLTTGARGVNAPQMAQSDAASFLLAIAAQGDHTKAADTVREVGELSLNDSGFGRRNGVRSVFSPDSEGGKMGLHQGQSLRSAFAALIDRYSLEAPLPLASRQLSTLELEPHDSSSKFAALRKGKLPTDPTPRSLSLSVTREADRFTANITIRQMGGDEVTFEFAASAGITSSSANDDNVEVTTTVKAPLIHAVICAIRNAPPESKPYVEVD